MGEEITPPEGAAPLVRRLATILCADIAGYSQKMGANEERTVQVFRGHREIFESLVSLHRGRIFNTAGDALLAEFSSAVEAVRCATEIQAALATRNEHLAAEDRMVFRMGINLGDVIVQGEDLLGDGVNVAARIQTATAPGGICISGSVYDQIQNKLSLDFKPLGEQTYKNIAKPVRTYTIADGAAVTKPAKRRSWRIPAAIAAAVLLIASAGYLGYRQLDARQAEQARLESQLAAQKQAAEQAQRAAEDAKQKAEIEAQKQAAEQALRRAEEERARLDQERTRLENEKQQAEAAKKQAVEQAQRAAEDARRNAEIQAQKQAADEALRRAQEERNRLDQERARIENEKRQAEAAKKQAVEQAQRAAEDAKRKAEIEAQNQAAEAAQRAPLKAAPAVSLAPKSAAAYDGAYKGKLCSQTNEGERCFPVGLVVRDGMAEGSWKTRMTYTATIKGTVEADGAVKLNVSSWKPFGNPMPVAATIAGRVTGDTMTAWGRWELGGSVRGNWKRVK